MAKHLSQKDAVTQAVTYFPSFLESRQKAKVMDSWMHGTQYDLSEDLDLNDRGYGRAFSPNKASVTPEYENLRGLSPNNFGGLIVTSMAQLAVLEGISRTGESDVLPVWQTFVRNQWPSKQSSIYRAALGHGASYGIVMPGKDPLTGAKMSKMTGKSALRMSAFFQDDEEEWPVLAIEAVRRYVNRGLGPVQDGWTVKMYDDYVMHRLYCEGDGSEEKQWTYVDFVEHGTPVPPVARCANWMDLEGRAHGEIEPVLPILRRVDQDTFDRLINQRFGAWQVRYIAGMAKPTKADAAAEQAMRLRVEDLLVSTSEKTKFGVLPGGNLDNQIKATDADLRILSAVTQLPPHHLLGLSSNLQAEALAAATEGLQRRAFAFRVNAGEFNTKMARLAALQDGDLETAAAWDLNPRWRDTESASMSQAADALGKFADSLGVPVEMLWERIPGWTDTDVERAKGLVKDGEFDTMIRELINGPATPAAQTGTSGAPSGNPAQ